MINPDGSTITQIRSRSDLGLSYSHAGAGPGMLAYRMNYSIKRIVGQHWTTRPFSIAEQYTPACFTCFNPMVDTEYTACGDERQRHDAISCEPEHSDGSGG